MLAAVQSCAILGPEEVPVAVEVDVSRGQASKITVVGLPDAAVRESIERVRSALLNTGCYSTSQRLTINLAPSDIRKVGSVYELPIAVGLLQATSQVLNGSVDAMFLGELSLDGTVRQVSSVLPRARQQGMKCLFVPTTDAPIPGIEVYPVSTLSGLVQHLHKAAPLTPHVPTVAPDEAPSLLDYEADFSFIKGLIVAPR